MAEKPYRPKLTAAEKKAYKERNFGEMGKTGGMGGKYGRKSENLSTKELKAAGALKASKKRTVDISQTKREGGLTLGPKGKPLTGTVTLANGKTAVYKGGKRVQAGPAAGGKTKTIGGSGKVSGGTSKNIKTTRVTPQARGEGSGTTRNSNAKNSTPSNLTGFSVNKPGTYVPTNIATTNLRGRTAKNPEGGRVTAPRKGTSGKTSSSKKKGPWS